MIKYKATVEDGKIQAIEVECETNRSVYFKIPGASPDAALEQEDMRCESHGWFDSFTEAKHFLIGRAQRERASARVDFNRAKRRLAIARDLREEDSETEGAA